MSDRSQLGPLVRLWGISTQQLPSTSEEAEELAPFLVQILQEAVPFIDSAAPKAGSPNKLWKSKGTKSHTDSAASVEVSERVVSAKDLSVVKARNDIPVKVDGEYWACRRSVHEDAAKKGTASWEEFDKGFRLEHGETEKNFTPNVLGAHEAMRWNCAGVEATEEETTWHNFSLLVEEMRHKVGRPVLKDRTFPVLQMTCQAKGRHEFLVVSIPVPDFNDAETSKLAKEKGAQIAFYVSVERFRKLEDGKIEWVMATASDAAGVLPSWVQNMAMPGMVWKDVPLFLGWKAKAREGGGKETGSSTAAEARQEEPKSTTAADSGKVADVSGKTSETEALKATATGDAATSTTGGGTKS
ncbi:hypothetical protein F5Y15DRAFT_359073 [Xylariaceae sp. FL0016]|nr:hypothetical protein F5Y15DRAFT_359073 [Xylariaceae sp. FL0016]